jgi:hypothetical protein
MSPRSRMLTLAAVLALGLFAGTRASLAHHSVPATFDDTRLVTIEGTVASVRWVNPHALLFLEVEGDTGQIETWAIETSGPNVLARAGFERDWLVAGERLSLDVWTALDDSNLAHARVIRWDNGRLVELPESRWMSAAETSIVPR